MFELTSAVRVYGKHEDAPDNGVILVPYEVASYPWWSETTRNILEWMGQNNLQGKSVLDFGCGASAILGLSAFKVFGASNVTFIENDPQMIPITNEQLRANEYFGIVWKVPPAGFWDIAVVNVGDAKLVGEVSRLARNGCGTDRDGSLITW